MTWGGAILALLYALPEILALIRRMNSPQDVVDVLNAANTAIDLLAGADTPEKKKNAAKALADYWANRAGDE